MAAYDRRTFKGNVAYTVTLASNIVAGDTSIPISDGSTFPDGSAGPFGVTLGPGTAGEEKVKIATRTGNTLTVAASGRGYDGTTAASHSSGVAVVHTLSAVDLDEANQVVNVLLGGKSSATAANMLDNLGAPDLNETAAQTFAGPIVSNGNSSTFANGINLGTGSTGTANPCIYYDGSNVYIQAAAGKGVRTTANVLDDGAGNAAIAGALAVAGSVGFYGHAAAAKPTITGSRGGNAALASLLTALAGLGLIMDSTTA